MNFFANLLKLILIIALIGGIGYGCYALFFKPASTQSVLSEYDSVITSDNNKIIQKNVGLDSANAYNEFSKSVDSIYDEVVLLYLAEYELMDTMLPEVCFGKQSGVMTKVINLLSKYNDAVNSTAGAMGIFNSDKQTFGANPSSSQITTLKNEFKTIANCLLVQVDVLVDINAELLPYAKANIYGGDNVAKYNIKYLMLESLNMQGNTLINVLQSEQGVVGEKLFDNTKQLYQVFCDSKNNNFVRTNATITDEFVVDYDKIDKKAFFNALDKNKYYNDMLAVLEKDAVQTVMIYFGFIMTNPGGE
ncbi:MAG: hypothetical protein IKC79_00030 [Clostridia bacterium]|nr:hypothetical protein [Clostridia bacterium]